MKNWFYLKTSTVVSVAAYHALPPAQKKAGLGAVVRSTKHKPPHDHNKSAA